LVESKGTKPLPVDLSVLYTDGTSEKIHRNISVWEKGNKTILVSFSSGKKIKSLMLGSTYVPDINKSDNVYKVN